MEQDLKKRIEALEKKVNDLYNPASFPQSVIDGLVKRGLVKIEKTLLTPFTTTDGYNSKYYYMFADIDGKRVVFSNISAQDFTLITDVNTSTDVFTSNSHGFTNGDLFTYWTDGTTPSPISNGDSVYVRDVTTNTFKITNTIGGAALNITTTGTGTQYLQRINIIV